MMNRKTYTVEWHDKRHIHQVVRWSEGVNGVRIGTTVESFNSEDEAMEVAGILNQGEDLDLYHNQESEFDT
jgi:hypothetical protein